MLVLQLGFDAFFFARADYQDLQKRRKDRTMEVIWQGSKSLGSSAQVLQTVSKFASQNFAVADQMLLMIWVAVFCIVFWSVKKGQNELIHVILGRSLLGFCHIIMSHLLPSTLTLTPQILLSRWTVVPVSKIPNQNQVWFLELVLESEFIRGWCLYTAAMSCNLQTFCGKESWLLAVGYNMQDDPRLSDYNVPELVDLFVEYVQNQVHNAAFTQTSDSGLCKCNSPFGLSFWV